MSDHDPARAGEARLALLDELAEPRTIGFGNHFADVVFAGSPPATTVPSGGRNPDGEIPHAPSPITFATQ